MSQYKVGDLVRVSGNSFNTNLFSRPGQARHHIVPGAVCVVTAVQDDKLDLRGPSRKDARFGPSPFDGQPLGQTVYPCQVKPAKQATKKRELYQGRR